MTSDFCQPCILKPPPAFGRSITCRLQPGADGAASLGRLRDGFSSEWGVVGLGEPLARALGRAVAGLRPFPELAGRAGAIPSTQRDLWIFLHARDRSALFDIHERLRLLLDPHFTIEDAIGTFTYRDGRDLTGYQDGTENPRDEAAAEAALVPEGEGFAGSSFAAVQRWEHDLDLFFGLTTGRQDAVIGRRIDTNEEIADALPTAHVKRAAQESFDPPAFVLRRSMPWETPFKRGLEFIAFGATLDKYERVLRRMAGLEDGIIDALFTFSRPVTGGYYWCPPVAGARLDLRLLGL